MTISRDTAQDNTQGGAASTSVTFTYLTTPVQGRLMVAFWSYRLSSTTISATPSGWTNIERREGNINTVISYKVAGASEPTVHTWTLSASVKSAGFASTWNSTNGWTSPFDVSASNSAATGTTGLASGTTATSNGSAEHLVCVAYGCDTNATWSNHSGSGATITEIAGGEVSSTGGPTSSRNTTSPATGIRTSGTSAFSCTADLSASNNWAAVIAVFKEDAASSTALIAQARQTFRGVFSRMFGRMNRSAYVPA